MSMFLLELNFGLRFMYVWIGSLVELWVVPLVCFVWRRSCSLEFCCLLVWVYLTLWFLFCGFTVGFCVELFVGCIT